MYAGIRKNVLFDVFSYNIDEMIKCMIRSKVYEIICIIYFSKFSYDKKQIAGIRHKMYLY
jgi:hypothetical protein